MATPKKKTDIKKIDESPESEKNLIVAGVQISREDQLKELSKIAKAAAALAEYPDSFEEAYAAYHENDPSRFIAALDHVDLGDRCEWICRFICMKHCHAICRRFCPDAPDVVDVREMIAFAKALPRLLKKKERILELLDAIDKDDVKTWQKVINELEMRNFCHQLCHIFCHWNCRLRCLRMCPQRPLITRVGSIPVSQFNPNGFANGPSIPPNHVQSPDISVGRTDHPFGAQVWLMGMFNMPTATEYLVEVSPTGDPGSYTPIIVSVTGYNVKPIVNPLPPFHVTCIRNPSPAPDSGWFKISEICDSDGGTDPLSEKTLLYWNTLSPQLPDGPYYLRLRVRDGITTRVSDPRVVQTDNTGTFLPSPAIKLELKKKDGKRIPLKCGKVKKGDGLIVITIQAYDPHYSQISVTARGNTGASVPIIDENGVYLSKTYNGDPADQGYPVPTEFVWNPWIDPEIEKHGTCCWNVYIDAWDRTIINDHYSGGSHHKAVWEAIEIGF